MFFQTQIDFTAEELLLYLRKSQSDDPNLTVEEVLEKHEKILDEWCERNMDGKVPERNKFREIVSGEKISHMFYASKGLQGSTVINQDLLTRGIAEPDYTNDYVAVKWFDDCQTALAHFGDVSA